MMVILYLAAILTFLYVVTRHSILYVCSVVNSCKSADVAFRILLALNIVSLILDTMQDSVNTFLITMDLQPNFFLCTTGIGVLRHT